MISTISPLATTPDPVVVGAHDAQRPEKYAAYFRYARTEIEPLLPPAPRRVLDVGCGAGATSAWLRSVRPIAYAAGIELMPAAAVDARRVLDQVVVGNIDAMALPFPEASFDLILTLDILEHLFDPWAVIRRLTPLLAPGGCLIASIPNIAHYSVSLPLLRGRWQYSGSGLLDSTHLRFFVESTAVALVQAGGLVVDRRERNIEVPWDLQPLIGWRRNEWVKRSATRLLPQAFTYQFLIRGRWPSAGPT